MHTGPATWVFDTFPDESPGIRLDYHGAATGAMCSVYLAVFISDEHDAEGFLTHRENPWYVRETGYRG